MIKISFNPDKLSARKKKEWKDWLNKSQAATAKVIDEWEQWMQAYDDWLLNPAGADPPAFKPGYNERLWKDLRDWMLENVFHNKCAYCEIPIVGFVGDTEHFRPKNSVRIAGSGYAKIKNWCGQEIDHPGYFWLAYNWKNLLPACQNCNRKVKLDLFPVEAANVAIMLIDPKSIADYRSPIRHRSRTDLYYLEPEDLDRLEKPRLLHPFFDDPREHLKFAVDGMVLSVDGSQRGEYSINNFSLNQDKLVLARRREMVNGLSRYLRTIDAARPQDRKQAVIEVIAEYVNSESPFAGAVLSYIHDIFDGAPMDPYILLEEI